MLSFVDDFVAKSSSESSFEYRFVEFELREDAEMLDGSSYLRRCVACCTLESMDGSMRLPRTWRVDTGDVKTISSDLEVSVSLAAYVLLDVRLSSAL